MKELLPERQQLIDKYKPEGFTFVSFLYPLQDDEDAAFMRPLMDNPDQWRLINLNTNTLQWEIILYRKIGPVESIVRKAIQAIRHRS